MKIELQTEPKNDDFKDSNNFVNRLVHVNHNDLPTPDLPRELAGIIVFGSECTSK